MLYSNIQLFSTADELSPKAHHYHKQFLLPESLKMDLPIKFGKETLFMPILCPPAETWNRKFPFWDCNNPVNKMPKLPPLNSLVRNLMSTPAIVSQTNNPDPKAHDKGFDAPSRHFRNTSLCVVNQVEKASQKQANLLCDGILSENQPCAVTPMTGKNPPAQTDLNESVQKLSKRSNEEYKKFTHQISYQQTNIPKRRKRIIHCKYKDCTATFNKTWNFVDHARMHLGIRPYKCHIWGKRFTQSGNMKKHLATHKFIVNKF